MQTGIKTICFVSSWWLSFGYMLPKPTFTTTITKSPRANNAFHSQNVDLQRKDISRESCSPTALHLTSSITMNEELIPGVEAINAVNGELLDALDRIYSQPFFRLYSVDILGSCEYMPQELFECYSESCEIYPIDEEEVPEEIRAVDQEEFEFAIDGWARWDMPSEDYYDTVMFPEGYTGYDGSEVWEFIHQRICFQGYGYDDDHWKADFNKAVSGLHSMISAQVTRGIQERIDFGEEFSDDEVWRDPQAEFSRRLSTEGETPLALENLYFAFMLLLKAASKARTRLLMDCESGKIGPAAARDLKVFLDFPILEDVNVAAASKKLKAHARKDSDTVGNLWEARMRSRELLRIMNCVQCNKCRLHGKISVMGLSTALQILVGQSGEGGDVARVHRVELATLVAALHKFSKAIEFTQQNLE